MCVVDLVEMGKNINQDKTLAMQRYVEEYHEQVNKMASHLTHSQAEETSHKQTHHSAKQGKEWFQYIASLMVLNTALNEGLKVYRGFLNTGWASFIKLYTTKFMRKSFRGTLQKMVFIKIQCIRKNFVSCNKCVNLHMETHWTWII